MIKEHFPARNTDGSFCVEIGLTLAHPGGEKFASEIQEWIGAEWMPRNSTWRRAWRTGAELSEVNEQILYYKEEFLNLPQVVSSSDTEMRLRIEGNKTAKFWRDWLVSRLLPDLKEEFSGIGDVLFIRNCGGEP